MVLDGFMSHENRKINKQAKNKIVKCEKKTPDSFQ